MTYHKTKPWARDVRPGETFGALMWSRSLYAAARTINNGQWWTSHPNGDEIGRGRATPHTLDAAEAAALESLRAVYPDLDVETALLASVTTCARCKGDHAVVAFMQLTNPDATVQRWAMCPTLSEPILMRVWSDDEVKP